MTLYLELMHYIAGVELQVILWRQPVCLKGKGKGKIHPRTGHEGPEGEQSYTSTLSLTSAIDRGGWSTPHPGRFIPMKETRYSLYRRFGGPQGRSGRVRKIKLPLGLDPRTFQPEVSRYTDCAIAASSSCKKGYPNIRGI
jgi:hypothetical protein